MSKIMSVFEKLNLVEKTNQESQDTFELRDVHVQQESEAKGTLEENIEDNKVEIKPSVSSNPAAKLSEKDQIKINRKYTVEEIYTSCNLENSDVNTVFMLGNFINALPDSLPYEIKKKSLVSIVASSNMDLMKLLGDGEKRLDSLDQFSNQYYDLTISTVEQYKKKIAELKSQILYCEEQIRINETLFKEQNNTIKFEMDRVEGIINFFNKGE